MSRFHGSNDLKGEEDIGARKVEKGFVEEFPPKKTDEPVCSFSAEFRAMSM